MTVRQTEPIIGETMPELSRVVVQEPDQSGAYPTRQQFFHRDSTSASASFTSAFFDMIHFRFRFPLPLRAIL